jgi:hypothetical protein
MNTANLAETIKFFINNGANWANDITDKIINFPNAEDFRGVNIIVVENSTNNHKLQQCYGIEIALEMLRKDPATKVILYGFLPIEYLQAKKPEIDIVLKYENARFIRAPFTMEDFADIFNQKNTIELTYTITDEIRRKLGVINHSLGHVKDISNPKPGYEVGEIASAIQMTKEYFPAVHHFSDLEVLQFLKSVSADREEIMKGQEISGVYCDVEGTILVNGDLNQSTIELLREYEQQGKKITIWTDGDIETLVATLTSLGFVYPLKSKFDYAGARAEIVIDDKDEYTFSAMTKISAKKFICVTDRSNTTS